MREALYATQADFYFPLTVDRDTDRATSAVLAAGDVKISKDGGTFANVTNLPTQIGSTGWWKITLTATELTCKKAIIEIVDQTSTKIWNDTGFVVDTYGHASAMHEFSRSQNVNDIADVILQRDVDNVEDSAPDHSLAGVILKQMSRVRISGSTMTIYKTDGTTTFAQQTVTLDANASPVTEQTVSS
jgi:hypothetical protein